MRKTTVLLVNILGTIVLAIAVSQVGLYSWCYYQEYSGLCRQEGIYWGVAVISVLVVLVSFLLPQWSKTGSYFTPRKRPIPKSPGFLDQTFQTVLTLEKQEPGADVGWWVEFEDGIDVLVARKDFYGWLVTIANAQLSLLDKGQVCSKSALSQRANSGLSRRKWRAYIHLLKLAKACEQVNYNILALKDDYLLDQWAVIKELEGKLNYVEVKV